MGGGDLFQPPISARVFMKRITIAVVSRIGAIVSSASIQPVTSDKRLTDAKMPIVPMVNYR